MFQTGLFLRTHLQPGDLGAIVSLHGTCYGEEQGFDGTFEAYVAGPLAEFVLTQSPRGRIWVAESEGRVVGSVAIVEVSETVGQLRWFLVDPSMRGRGLGRELLQHAVAFAKSAGYGQIFLWTVSALTAAGHLYRAAGFRKVQEKPAVLWSVEVVEEKYELDLEQA